MAVVQLVERQIVILVVVGSSPIGHPKLFEFQYGGIRHFFLVFHQASGLAPFLRELDGKKTDIFS